MRRTVRPTAGTAGSGGAGPAGTGKPAPVRRRARGSCAGHGYPPRPGCGRRAPAPPGLGLYLLGAEVGVARGAASRQQGGDAGARRVGAGGAGLDGGGVPSDPGLRPRDRAEEWSRIRECREDLARLAKRPEPGSEEWLRDARDAARVVKPPPARRSGSVAGVTGACVCDASGLNLAAGGVKRPFEHWRAVAAPDVKPGPNHFVASVTDGAGFP